MESDRYRLQRRRDGRRVHALHEEERHSTVAFAVAQRTDEEEGGTTDLPELTSNVFNNPNLKF